MSNYSDQLNELAAALSLAQAEIEDAEKSKANPAFRSTYADLGSVVDACKPALVKHGLSFVQVFEPSEPGTLALTTMLLHKSGQWISGTCVMPLLKNDPQGYGSCATYARRYGLAAMVGVCQSDDDANAASGRQQQRREEEPRRQQQAPPPRTESNGDRAATTQAVRNTERPLAVAGAPGGVACADCGKTGLPDRVVDFSRKQFGAPVCFDCQKARKQGPSDSLPMDDYAPPTTDAGRWAQ